MSTKVWRSLLLGCILLDILALLGIFTINLGDPRPSLSITVLVIGCLLLSILSIILIINKPTKDNPSEKKPTDEKPRINPDSSSIEGQSEFTGMHGETVKVELGWQGYLVKFETNLFGDDDPVLKDNVEDDHRIIQPIICLTATKEINDIRETVNTFNPSLKFSVTYTEDNIIEKGVSPNDIIILIYDHNAKIWKPYPSSRTMPEENKWMITLTIEQWTSHCCFGR